MTKITLTADALVVVCDGRRARFFSNAGDAFRPQLILIEEMEGPPNPRAADQGANRPGRLGTQHGPLSAVEAADPHERKEAEFVRAVADRLAEVALARKTTAIIITAAPRALAHLREELPPEVRAQVVAELGKDYTKTPVLELTRLLIAG